MCLGGEVILLSNMIREDIEGHPHKFVSFQRSAKVTIFNIEARTFRIFGAKNAVPTDFAGREIGGTGSERPWIIDEVSSGRDVDSAWILFLGSAINDDSPVCDNLLGCF